MNVESIVLTLLESMHWHARHQTPFDEFTSDIHRRLHVWSKADTSTLYLQEDHVMQAKWISIGDTLLLGADEHLIHSHLQVAETLEAKRVLIKTSSDISVVVPLIANGNSNVGLAAFQYEAIPDLFNDVTIWNEVAPTVAHVLAIYETLSKERRASIRLNVFQEFRYLFTWGYGVDELVKKIAEWLGMTYHFDYVMLNCLTRSHLAESNTERWIGTYSPFMSEDYSVPSICEQIPFWKQEHSGRTELEIMADDQYGRLIAHNWYSREPIDAETVDMLRLLLPWISTGITNALARAHHEEQYRTDSLTGLYISSYIKQQLSDKLRQADAANQSIHVIMIDLDEFKAVNDTLGHLVGDQVLAQASECIRQIEMPCAMAGRYGGDEFLVFAVDVDSDTVSRAMQQLSEEIRRISFLFRLPSTLGMSYGISVYPDDGLDATGLINHADQRLYRMKRAVRLQKSVH